MERKKKSVGHKKSEIEKQYEEFFNYIPKIPPIRLPEPKEYMRTWTTYGISQFDVLLKK